MEALRQPKVIPTLVIEIACLQLREQGDIDGYDLVSTISDCEHDQPVELYYLRILATLSKFLLMDTSTLSEDDAGRVEKGFDLIEKRDGAALATGTLHRYIRMEHLKLKDSAFRFYPEVDVLWLSQEAESENMADLQRYYG